MFFLIILAACSWSFKLYFLFLMSSSTVAVLCQGWMQVLEAPGSAVSLPHSQAAQGTAELFELLQQAWDTWEHNGNISTFQPLAGQ